MIKTQTTPRQNIKTIILLIIFLSLCTLAINVTAEQSLLNTSDFSSNLINPITADLQINPPTSENLIRIDSNHIETFTIDISQLGKQDRTIVVYLPTGYFLDNSSYPVLYAQGAQDLFLQPSISNSDWYINEPLFKFYASSFDTDFILVGIAKDSIHFWDEYSPWVNEKMYLWMDPYDANRVEGGDGDAYLEFLIQTLKPAIDGRFRTLEDRENTAIAGYKMGGLISIYAGLTRSDIFSKVITLSPSIWFSEGGGLWLSNNQLFKFIEQTEVPRDVSFLIDIAEEERTTDIKVRPAINDQSGRKISFPQAYLEGASVLISTLLNNGVDQNKIIQGDDLEFQISETIETSNVRISGAYNYHLPLFLNQGKQPLESFTISMAPYLNRNRRIWVYLPPDYYRSSKAYQVIYLTDAQHIYGSDTGANIEDRVDLKVDEILDQLYYETGKGTIAVAVEFDANYPWDEYSAWDNSNMHYWIGDSSKNFTGVGEPFLNFNIYNLKPYIDSHYRTLPDRDNTAIGGGSRCALFATYAALTKPNYFSKLMAFSPAVWLAEDSTVWLSNNGLKKWFNSYIAPSNVRYYLYVGTLEDSAAGSYYLQGVEMIRNELINDGVSTYLYAKNTGGTHNQIDWRPYVKPALKWLGFY